MTMNGNKVTTLLNASPHQHNNSYHRRTTTTKTVSAPPLSSSSTSTSSSTTTASTRTKTNLNLWDRQNISSIVKGGGCIDLLRNHSLAPPVHRPSGRKTVAGFLWQVRRTRRGEAINLLMVRWQLLVCILLVMPLMNIFSEFRARVRAAPLSNSNSGSSASGGSGGGASSASGRPSNSVAGGSKQKSGTSANLQEAFEASEQFNPSTASIFKRMSSGGHNNDQQKPPQYISGTNHLATNHNNNNTSNNKNNNNNNNNHHHYGGSHELYHNRQAPPLSSNSMGLQNHQRRDSAAGAKIAESRLESSPQPQPQPPPPTSGFRSSPTILDHQHQSNRPFIGFDNAGAGAGADSVDGSDRGHKTEEMTNTLADAEASKLDQTQISNTAEPLEYPNYCWFDGLENRILLEYPQLKEIVHRHDKARQRHQWGEAVKLHRQLYRQIYLFELNKLEGQSGGNKAIMSRHDKEDRAAYALFNLWANTPGDFSSQQSEYGNYLEPYFIHSHIEFWSYYYSPEHRESAREVLEQISVLAKSEELGPVEMLQVAMNIITLINSYKADLTLTKLIDKGLVDEQQYDDYLQLMVKLIERDEDFHDAAFDYVFTSEQQVHQVIDAQIERYLLRQLRHAT